MTGLDWLLDTSEFAPPSQGLGWTPGLVWLHAGSDLLIWLAFLSIPLVLAFLARHRGAGPYRRLFWLFAAFILACGFTHFLGAVMFQKPAYRLSGVAKLLTAVVSWAAVVALVPAVPRVLRSLHRAEETGLEMPILRETAPTPARSEGVYRRYIVALLAAVLAVLVRGLLDPLLKGDPALVIPLLAVVFVAWNSGFGPALVTLSVSMAAVVFFFVAPRHSFRIEAVSDQMAVGLFLFAGVGCALLGEAQRLSRERAGRHLADLQANQRELEAEVDRRRKAQAELEDLTGRLAAAQEQTAQTLAQLDTFVLNAPLGLAFFDTELRYVRLSKHLADANGQPIEAQLGRRLTDVLPNFPAEVAADYRRVLATGEPVTDRLVVRYPDRRTPDGRQQVWQSSYYPVRRPDGAVFGVGVVARDITDQLRAEDAVRQSEERYRFLAETIPALVWSNGPDGRTDYRNSRWTEYTGRPPEALDGDRAAEVVHPDDRERTADRWGRALEAGTKYQNELRLRRSDGAYRWFLAQAVPMRDEAGRVARWFGTCTDIDDQKRLQLELRQSLDRFRALTEAIPQLVWTTDPDGRVTFFNQRWVDYTAVTVDRWQDDGWRAVLHPDDADRMTNRWAEAVRTNADWFATECRLRRASDGQYRWHLAYAVPLRDADGRTVQWVGALTDIDSQRRQAEILERLVADRTAALTATNTAMQQEVEDRRRAEELVRATAVELGRSNEELEQFAYIASHDLQEPLRKIQAFGDRLRTRNRERLDDQGKDYLDRMLKAAARMRSLIEDLLSYSRVTTKGQPFARVDLNVIADGVLSDLETRIHETDAAVDVGPLPTIDADPTQLRQLLQNLIGNALKFHRPGVPPAVTVRAEVLPAEGDADAPPVCRLTVADNGIGFEEKYVDRIFQVFQRLHGRLEYEGTGVGLAICRKIAERHGGTITARSEPGVGATFTVTLPTRQPNHTHAEQQ